MTLRPGDDPLGRSRHGRGWLYWPASVTADGGLREARRTMSAERRLARYLRPYWPTVAFALFLVFASVAAGLATVWSSRILIDNVLGHASYHGMARRQTLSLVVFGTLGLFILSAGLGLIQTRVVVGLSQRLIADLRAQLFSHLTRVSLRYHDGAGVGDSIYRVTKDTGAVQAVLLSGLLPTVSALVTLIFTFALMTRAFGPALTFAALPTAPFAVLAAKSFGHKIRRFSHTYSERESAVYAHAQQTFAGIRTVQAFAREAYETERFETTVIESKDATLRLVTLQTIFGVLVGGILACGVAFITWLAVQRAWSGHMTIGAVVIYLAYAGSLYKPIQGLTSVFSDLQQAVASAERVFKVLDQPGQHEPGPAIDLTDRAAGQVAFRNVSFAYAAGNPVLRGVDFEAKRGQLVALVGPTGAGKSTIASLMLRLYEPTEGVVELDGVDITLLRSSWLREQVAYVPQDPMLFPVSVRENIRYGRLDATDEEVEQAARDANILDELLRDGRSLDTLVGDRGVQLSGGQRQRVAIARAFLKDAPVLLLDEPTSALDASTEYLIMNAVERLTKGRTCIVIAHRLATVHRANLVVVVDGGQVVERGTHRQLVRRRGLYRVLHEARFGEPTEVPRESVLA